MAVLKLMPYHAAMAHKLLVWEVAVAAHGKRRGPMLGVFFDEVSR